jgi:RNA polymerase sigma-70 factor (ECF subfamily)
MISTPNINDKELVNKLQNNEIEAFDILFRRYCDKLFRFSFSLLKEEEISKEIVQETFYRIWEIRRQIDSNKSFKSFLFSISYHLIIDELRLRMKDQEYRNFITQYFGEQSEKQVSTIDYQTIENKIKKAVEELPLKRKQIYHLSRNNGLSHKEIAKKLGITTKTVENQINLSLKHIKTRLGKEILPLLLFLSLFG